MCAAATVAGQPRQLQALPELDAACAVGACSRRMQARGLLDAEGRAALRASLGAKRAGDGGRTARTVPALPAAAVAALVLKTYADFSCREIKMTPDFLSALQAALEAHMLALLRLARRLVDRDGADMCGERH